MMEGRQGFGADPVQAVEVERLYVAGGADPVPVSKGTCFLTWASHKLASAVCGARANAEGQDIKAIAALKAR